MKGLKPGWAVKALVVALLLRCFSDAAAATNHSVGGAFGWDLSPDLQEWASQATFHVGDSLVFSYTPVHDVLEVNATDYGICHTVNPLETYKDGETVIPLMEEGDRYFMCGRVGHCAMGLKLHVHVLPQLMNDSNATSSAPGPSPTVSPPRPRHSPPPPPPHPHDRDHGHELPSSPAPDHRSTGTCVETTLVQPVITVLGLFMCLPRQLVGLLFPALLVIILGYAACCYLAIYISQSTGQARPDYLQTFNTCWNWCMPI